MTLSNIWGQGQLFAFSALDGKTDKTNDFVGTLSGDRLGIQFYATRQFFDTIRRELAVVGYQTKELTYDAVLSDYICAQTDTGAITFIYADTHLIIGSVCEGAMATVFVDGPCQTEVFENIALQDTQDGDFTALATDKNRFAFAYGQSRDEVIKRAQRGLTLSLEKEAQKKLAFHEAHPMDGTYAKLYNKCLSVMKSQLYSPTGQYSQIWSTPDRLPHRHMWFWDSVFHTVGHRNIHPDVAEKLLLSIFANQKEDGKIPMVITPTFQSICSQPPLIAWGALKVFEKSKNLDFLREVFEKNARLLSWFHQNRKPDEKNLYAWYVREDTDHCRGDESGMDNSPRFDHVKHIYAIDLSCFMANEARSMAKIADLIGENAAPYKAWFEDIKHDVNEVLYHDGFYYDYDRDKKALTSVKSMCGFLPLFAGICNEKQVRALAEELQNPETFGTPFPVPSVALNDPSFSTDMWRGPAWMNYTYMILDGLLLNGQKEFFDALTKKALSCLNQWYEQFGTLYEFYDSQNQTHPSKLTRKGHWIEPYNFQIRYPIIRDYGWTVATTLDLICQQNKQ